MKRENKGKDNLFDDGRVIADMSIDGMPGPLFRRKSFEGLMAKKRTKESIKLSKKDRWAIIGGIASSYILFGVIIFGLFALFLLFATKVWFK